MIKFNPSCPAKSLKSLASALEAERGDVGVKDYPVHDGSGEVCVTHLGDMGPPEQDLG